MVIPAAKVAVVMKGEKVTSEECGRGEDGAAGEQGDGIDGGEGSKSTGVVVEVVARAAAERAVVEMNVATTTDVDVAKVAMVMQGRRRRRPRGLRRQGLLKGRGQQLHEPRPRTERRHQISSPRVAPRSSIIIKNICNHPTPTP